MNAPVDKSLLQASTDRMGRYTIAVLAGTLFHGLAAAQCEFGKGAEMPVY